MTDKSIKIPIKKVDPNAKKDNKAAVKKKVQPPHSLSHKDDNSESSKDKSEREGKEKHESLQK